MNEKQRWARLREFLRSWNQSEKQMDQEWDRIQKRGLVIKALEDSDYPSLLRQISSPPPIIYMSGEPP